MSLRGVASFGAFGGTHAVRDVVEKCNAASKFVPSDGLGEEVNRHPIVWAMPDLVALGPDLVEQDGYLASM